MSSALLTRANLFTKFPTRSTILFQLSEGCVMCLGIFSVFNSPLHHHPIERGDQVSLSRRVYDAFLKVLASLKAFFQRLFCLQEPEMQAEDPIVVRMRTFEDTLWELLTSSVDAPPNAERDRFLEEHLTLHKLCRICLNSTRTFEKRVDRDQFEASFSALASDGREKMIFDQVDAELNGYVSISLAEERYSSSRKILAELMSRGMQRERALRVLASLTHRGCHEATELVTKLFTKIEAQEWNKRKVRLESSENPIRIEVKFADRAFQGVEVRVNYKVIRPRPLVQGKWLISVSTRTWIEGSTGHAMISGNTSA